MKLNRLSERIWVYPYEEERDRPNLSYIRGDHFSIAVDAGHSDAHTAEFYRALGEAGLPLPKVTAVTHWHWDHTLGMHAVHGLTAACTRTNEHLKQFRQSLSQPGGRERHLALHESIRREYAGGKPIITAEADIVFSGELLLDAGNCPVRLIGTDAPHTDDSVLVFAESEGVLFIGDAACDTFPDGVKDPMLAGRLADTIRGLNAGICLEGHWAPLSAEETIRDLLEQDIG